MDIIEAKNMKEYKNKLILSSSRKSWQVSSSHGTESDKANIELWKKIWSRDNHTCFFCGFKATRFQEVHHIDDRHSNNDPSNLTTVCSLCHQTFHLNTVSTTNGGKIIWLPEFSQQDLNHLCRAIFVAKEQSDENEIAEMWLSIYQSLESRTLIMDQYFHNGASDPGTFGQVLLNLEKELYNKREEFLYNFKLLPSPTRFPLQIKYWKKHIYNDISIDKWKDLLKLEDGLNEAAT